MILILFLNAHLNHFGKFELSCGLPLAEYNLELIKTHGLDRTLSHAKHIFSSAIRERSPGLAILGSAIWSRNLGSYSVSIVRARNPGLNILSSVIRARNPGLDILHVSTIRARNPGLNIHSCVSHNWLYAFFGHGTQDKPFCAASHVNFSANVLGAQKRNHNNLSESECSSLLHLQSTL